jgi:tetratricopeptide (TPR) repeat protein
VAIDRAATLRNAEKLLRQGKLESAIVEYLRLVEDQPQDWNTANILGDLYVRTGQTDKAIQQFVRIADSLSREGFFPKAAALYKKVLKLRPGDEHALIQAGEMAARQGVLVDARAYFRTVAEQRLARGDRAGAADIRVRLGALDPTDFQARRGAARARLELGDEKGALDEFKGMAADLAEKGELAEAVAVLREAAALLPGNEGVQSELFAIYMAAGDLSAARGFAVTPAHFRTLGKAYFSAGHVDDAAELLAAGMVTNDPELILKVAETKLSAGAIEEGVDLLRRLLSGDRASADSITRLGWELAEWAPDTGLRVVELTTETAIREFDWATAAATLQEFVRRVPKHIPALLRLVEVCVDGGLETALLNAQVSLADAYLAIGAAAEARVISEDLIAREPMDPGHRERLQRSLTMLGVDEMTKAVNEASPAEAARVAAVGEGEIPPDDELAEIDGREPAVEQTEIEDGDLDGDQFEYLELTASSIDLEHMFAEVDRLRQDAAPEGVEIDLGVLLDDLEPEPSEPRAQPSGPPGSGSQPDLEEVFERMRVRASSSAGRNSGEQEFERGVALREAGLIEQSIQAFEIASKAPAQRFRAAASIGRIYRERGRILQAIEWLERAAEAPAPTTEASHALFYELADALESAGELARALAVCLELQADAGDFRDLSARIDRLTRTQVRG